jgi:hypothetical protein
MKAILITQNIKDKNKAYKNNTLGSVVIGLPNRFFGNQLVINKYKDLEHLHAPDGWFPVAEKQLITSHQRYGVIEFDADNLQFVYPIIDFTSQEIEDFEQSKIDDLPTLAMLFASEIGIFPDRSIDLQIDQIEIFKPNEKVYHLLGNPLFKEYYKDQDCVCRLEYIKKYQDLTHEGITKTEFIGTCTKFIFYKDEARLIFDEKTKITKSFSLVPTNITDQANQVVDVLWYSADRGALLRNERYKSEQVMKSFNPALYDLFIGLFGDFYLKYKDTGINTDILNAVLNATHEALDGQVMDDDKAVIFGQQETYPPLTVRGLIIIALP